MSARFGIFCGLGASVIWGLAPLFFARLTHVPPPELLAHRILWAMLMVGIWCQVTGRMPRVRATLADPRQRRVLALSATLITVNWFTFLWAIQAGRVTEAGIGYYIMPLMSVALGVVVLGERLRPRQWAAVALAGLAVSVLALGLGAAPVVPLVLATTFALYGLIRKRAETGAIVGFQTETVLLALPAALWLLALHSGLTDGLDDRPGRWFGRDLETSLLIVASGPMTGLPLILFAEAARNLRLGTLGLMQYINPTLQIAVAALFLGESLTPWHWMALGLIWTALALYSSSRADRPAAAAPVGVTGPARAP